MAGVDEVLAHLEAQEDAALERLFSFIAIESISTDPQYQRACQEAAEMVRGFLQDAGFSAEVAPTSGHPMVVGKKRCQQSGSVPHLLFYGHYDVQPVDPLTEWSRPPFHAQLLDDPVNGAVIHGRGASDDKGQLLTFLEAARAWHEVTGDLPIDVTVLLEGEEECGSPSLDGFLAERGADLKADFALICDTLQWDKDTPAITTMLRGLASVEVTVKGANRDLHSGMYGGAVVNPLTALARGLAALHDENGAVAVPGFYDGVLEPDPVVREQWQQSGFDEGAFFNDIGVDGVHGGGGEAGYSLLERLWCRPTVEINGLWGGYTGPGHKTVIPALAHGKLSFRLVAGQDPKRVLDLVQAHVKAACGPGVEVTFADATGAPAVAFDLSRPQIAAAQAVLEEEWGRPPVLLGCGGSIPIVEVFERQLEMDCLLIGFALNDDCIHAPDEKYNLRSFVKGARSFARLLGFFSSLRQ